MLRLSGAVGAPAERAQLLGEEQGLVPVRPGDEDGLLTEQLDPHRLLRVGWDGRVARGGLARLARADVSDRAVRDDAVVSVAPLDAQRVPSHLLEALDMRPLAHAPWVDDGFLTLKRGSSGARLGRMIDTRTRVAVTLPSMAITELADADGHIIEPGNLWVERLQKD